LQNEQFEITLPKELRIAAKKSIVAMLKLS